MVALLLLASNQPLFFLPPQKSEFVFFRFFKSEFRLKRNVTAGVVDDAGARRLWPQAARGGEAPLRIEPNRPVRGVSRGVEPG